MNFIDKKQILNILHQLNECQSRWYVAREAISFGRGGIKLMNKITGMSRTTIIKGMKELKKDSLSLNERIRMELYNITKIVQLNYSRSPNTDLHFQYL